MKALLLLGLLLLTGCAALPIRGRACYTGPHGEVCIGADAQGIVIEAGYRK